MVATDDGFGNAVMTFLGRESVTVIGVSPAFAGNKANMRSKGIPCFVAGTCILTPEDEVAVEDLRAGMLEEMLDQGPLPVPWVGGQTVGQAELAERPERLPIRIRDGSIGNRGDLDLSPQHAVLWEGGALVRAKHLAEFGGGRFRVQSGRRSLSYHHVLFARHQVILAKGAACESLYPGAMTRLALGPRVWAEIAARQPGVADAFAGKTLIESCAGPRARPLLSRRQAEALRARRHHLPGMPVTGRIVAPLAGACRVN